MYVTLRGLAPAPTAFHSICKPLAPWSPEPRQPAKARISRKHYTKAGAKANPQDATVAPNGPKKTAKGLTADPGWWFLAGQINGISVAGSSRFEREPGLFP